MSREYTYMCFAITPDWFVDSYVFREEKLKGSCSHFTLILLCVDKTKGVLRYDWVTSRGNFSSYKESNKKKKKRVYSHSLGKQQLSSNAFAYLGHPYPSMKQSPQSPSVSWNTSKTVSKKESERDAEHNYSSHPCLIPT